MTLVDLLSVDGGDVVAFVGGGGKSTLLLRLGRELADAGRPVVMTSTTRMGVDEIPEWAVVCRNSAAVLAALQEGRPAYLLRATDGEKVLGVDPAVVDSVASATDAVVLVEADGARRRPFKAPAENEPVVPRSATLLVVVVGMDAIGGTIGEVCHRPDRVAALTGRSLDDVVRADDVATVVAHTDGGRKGAPPDARLVLALTKPNPQQPAEVERIRTLLPGDIDVAVIAR